MTAGVRIDLPDLRSEQGAHLTHDPVRDLTAAVWTERWVVAPGDIVFAGGLKSDGLPTALSDPKRLAAVRATGLLDTGAEGPFDDLARLGGGDRLQARPHHAGR